MTLRSAMVLCAGLGTRLRPLTDVVPKPLVPIAGVPLVVRTLRQLRDAGVERVVVNLHHLGDRIREALGAGEALGLSIEYRVEAPEILGTGGGVRNALGFFGGEPFLLVNGDVVIDADFAALGAAHLRSGAAATMLVREVPAAEAARWGAVEIDADGCVRRLLGDGDPQPALTPTMFTGVHAIDPRRVASLLPAQGCIIRTAYRALVPRGEVFAVRHAGRFFDVGTVGRYLDANLDVAGARAVVDPTATVAPGVRLDRVVVWAGAGVDADERDAVITAFGTVRS